MNKNGKKEKPLIGFIGQGFIGKNYANDFENRGFPVVRFAREEPYRKNEARIKECDIVFIAVPTPSVPRKSGEQVKTKFDDSVVREVLSKVGEGKIAVIKSTLKPGTTDKLQAQYPNIIVLHSPEFLSVATAAHDAAHPYRNIVGVPEEGKLHRKAAELVLRILPDAPYELICSAREAEYIKYAGNNWFYFKVIFINLLFELTQKDGCNWETIRTAMAADPRIGSTHLNPVHKSGAKGGDVQSLSFNELHLEPLHKGGRGAGGSCFIKDFASFTELYAQTFPEDESGIQVLEALEKKNIDLLVESGKDLDLLKGIYGSSIRFKN